VRDPLRPSRDRPRPAPVAEVHSLPGRPLRGAGRAVPRAADLGEGGTRTWGVHGDDVRHHRGFPPLLLSPGLPHQPGLPVRPGLAWNPVRPEGRALVGRPSPRPPPLLRRTEGRPFARAARLLVEPRRLDPLGPLRRDPSGSGEGPAPLPGASLARPVGDGRAGRAGRFPLRRRGPARGSLGVLRAGGVLLARHLRHQLGGPRARFAALPDRRRFPQQPGARDIDDG
jgi:hypothetical protein